MTTSPDSIASDDSLGESWVNVDKYPMTPGHLSPVLSPSSQLFNGDMSRLLLEAQRESNNSSVLGSRGSTRRGSPRSPPNTPEPKLPELLAIEQEVEIDEIYINDDREELNSISPPQMIYDWSSRPDQLPPKEWNFRHPKKVNLSIRNSKAIKSGLSSDAMSIAMIASFISIIVGAGIGFYLGRRASIQITPVAMD